MRERPDVEKALAPLKGFQRTTVDYAFERLYGADCTRRFLVADEVGLGKTLVARGIIARAVDHLWDDVERIDVVYICSNADIARQNIRKLNVESDAEFELASRVTLLPTALKHLTKNKLNFVSFTPGTSFELKSNLGRQDERLLLYHLLAPASGLRGTGPMNLLQGSVQDTQAFRDRIRWYDADIDQDLAAAFRLALEEEARAAVAAGRASLRDRFEDLAARFGYARQNVPDADKQDRNALIGDLRALLARTCLQALEPDLVILDEFQRFKHLLDDRDDESAKLAQALFAYADESKNVQARVLLLSATPYKMYTLSHERDEDDHYADFLRTVQFLEGGEDGSLRGLLERYRRALYAVPQTGPGELLRIKAEIEAQLRRTMCRTGAGKMSHYRTAPSGLLVCATPNAGLRRRSSASN